MGLLPKKKKQPTMTREQALACIPVHNNVVAWEVQEDDTVYIEYNLVLKPFLHSIFKRFSGDLTEPPVRKIQLDQLGSSVWQMIDGKRSTADIILEFSNRQQVSTQEAEQSITIYLRELGKRGLIGMR